MTGEPQQGDGTPPMVPFSEWSARQQQPPADEPEDDREGAQPDGRATAMGCAAAWSLPPGLLMLVSASVTAGAARSHFVSGWAYSAVPPQPPPYLTWFLLIGGGCWAVCTVAELVHAYRLAGDYPARGPWARLPAAPLVRAMRRAGSGVDRRLSRGGGCLGILALVTLGPLLVIAWSTATAAAAPLWVLAVGAATLVHLTSLV